MHWFSCQCMRCDIFILNCIFGTFSKFGSNHRADDYLPFGSFSPFSFTVYAMPNRYHEPNIHRKSAPFLVDGLAIPYAEFIPKLYNFCLGLGFRQGLIMPSRAFCSDENQGLPIILLTKHFGVFPFNHGRVGGIVAVDRHGPHATHGEDAVILQASHVGYDPISREYGHYLRPQRQGKCISKSCGKLHHVIEPYVEQYNFAKERIFLHKDTEGRHLITVKNSFVDFSSHPVKNGLVLRIRNIVDENERGVISPINAASTSQTYIVNAEFRQRLKAKSYVWKTGQGECIGSHLSSDLFFFREEFHETDESILLERNLIEFMPNIVSSGNPSLRAAKINIQLEFARVVESIRRGHEYDGKNLLYIAGINLDVSPYKGFPATTYFIPWAAHVQLKDGTPEEYTHPLEQEALFAKLADQSSQNPNQIDLKENIRRMRESPRFEVRAPG